jgi:enoyl-CoA hydratase/carnithine racemase
MSEENLVLIGEQGHAGLITLNRPKALNALSLPMIRDITAALLKWRADPQIKLVAIRGTGKQADGSFAPFGAFCAGGDIRFFHQAALAGDARLEDFFTDEYSLNYLIHTYPKPYVVFMDGINMGGGMGLSQGKALAAPFGRLDERENRASPVALLALANDEGGCIRIVTERSKMAMPETNIGLFPDVGGGYFLSRCANAQPGVGEYLALTGQMMHAQDALHLGLADVFVKSDHLPQLWQSLGAMEPTQSREGFFDAIKNIANYAVNKPANGHFDQISFKNWDVFAAGDMPTIVARLEASADAKDQEVAAVLRKRSPLMLHVTLELVRRARNMNIANELRLERDLVRHCFRTLHLQRSGAATETAEGIRALAVDKDHTPKWNPARIEDVTPEMVQPFFASPWPVHAHPLAGL